MLAIHFNNAQSATKVTSERGTQFIQSCVEVWFTVGVTRRVFRYPFHLRVTAVTRKRSWSFCPKCRWRVTAKHTYVRGLKI